ncbi:MAG: hypothetical protein A2406_02250 [Candidatus Komeilibacteria bacterium RIFOXYC1_FULL_37_11]|uniref:CcmD family protein n=1 Tax=Candidatus Komeilibacteria bacterium RIFOXYC1_FULL_37_11 TaxID=1798555 RepID=A0A1G2BZN1_9BACT|nr:MAG: hypothetical protein A2406_02250 [Candidatus Komeilibacteria bacterium RIFOXYC1_FULL_37_11]OGY95522.1 MAG: hypothetical protein A2611_02375 [Candidatus Komeilibacteria bacterium RIFOXYD1_FULL_37_29]
MKQALIFSLLLLASTAQAQEVSTAPVPPFWQDKTFLMLAGGAVFLIIVLVIKKVLEKRAMKAYENNIQENQ